MMIEFYRNYLFLLFDPFKDFHFNSPHPQDLRTGNSLLIKGYTYEDF